MLVISQLNIMERLGYLHMHLLWAAARSPILHLPGRRSPVGCGRSGRTVQGGAVPADLHPARVH